jgi:NAD(P)-dependent dehydrogenase (short-subunit alcohol dehydrogenase family)
MSRRAPGARGPKAAAGRPPALAGQVAIVTGATGALGGQVARRLLDLGAHVVGTSRRAGSRVGRPGSGRGRASQLYLVSADMTDGAAVRRVVADTVARAGRLDILVNTVGGFAPGALADTDQDTWEGMLALNLTSAYLSCRAALGPMRQARRGRIVNVASRAALQPGPGLIAYTVAKTGLVALSRALAEEVRADGITVNVVLPGTMDTEANRRAMPDADRSSWVAPDAVAQVIAQLVSDPAGAVSGALVPC